jgi:hypothetical protein
MVTERLSPVVGKTLQTVSAAAISQSNVDVPSVTLYA